MVFFVPVTRCASACTEDVLAGESWYTRVLVYDVITRYRNKMVFFVPVTRCVSACNEIVPVTSVPVTSIIYIV